jgi:hypothetical protein
MMLHILLKMNMGDQINLTKLKICQNILVMFGLKIFFCLNVLNSKYLQSLKLSYSIR